MHSLLRRQLKRHFGSDREDAVPEALRPFVRTVDAAYEEFDDDRRMLERSLEISSTELVQSNSEMRTLLRAFPDLIIRLDASGTVLDVKGTVEPAAETPAGRRGNPASLAPEVAESVAKAAGEAASSRALRRIECVAMDGDSERVYEARLLPFLDDQVLAVVREITDLARAERARRQSLLVLEATLDAAADGILVVDEEGRIEVTNARFRAMWRLHPGSSGPRDYRSVLATMSSQVRDPRRLLEGAREAPAPPSGVFDTIELLDGRVVERYSQPARLGDSRAGRVWSFRDVTSQRQMEEQLLQSQKLEAIGQLAGGIAHDFNNLLTVILGYAQVVLLEIDAASPVRDEIDQIREAAVRAAALTGQLLTFSRRQITRPKTVNPNIVIGELEKMLRRLIREDIDLSLVLRSDVGATRVDPAQLGQIVMNLVVNARDAVSGGGRIVVETADIDLDGAYAAANPDARPGRHVVLSVTDTGCGMDEATRRRIFEPFFTTKERGKGTGLGLSTVYGIVKQCGGHIRVHSEVGRGATFRVLLPVATDPPCREPVAESRTALARGSETVLLVEDEAALRKLAGDALRKSGYRVIEAGNGEEALRVVEGREEEIDLVLTDIVMPGLGGLELVEALRSWRASIRVVYMSGYSNDPTLQLAEADSGEQVLGKPFAIDALLGKVRDCIDRQRSPGGGERPRIGAARPT